MDASFSPTDTQKLFQASLDNNVDCAIEALGGRPDLMARTEGTPPLHFAVRRLAPDVAHAIITAGVAVDSTDDTAHTALQLAAMVDCPECAQALLAGGADPDLASDTHKRTALVEAAEAGAAATAEVLLSPAAGRRADPDLVEAAGRVPLVLAVEAALTTLTLAERAQRVVGALITAGAKLDAIDGLLGFTALQLAAQTGASDIAKLLMDAGASTSAVDGLGRTALHMAADSGFSDIVHWLLDAGAPPCALDGDSRMAVDAADAGNATPELIARLDAASAHCFGDCPTGPPHAVINPGRPGFSAQDTVMAYFSLDSAQLVLPCLRRALRGRPDLSVTSIDTQETLLHRITGGRGSIGVVATAPARAVAAAALADYIRWTDADAQVNAYAADGTTALGRAARAAAAVGAEYASDGAVGRVFRSVLAFPDIDLGARDLRGGSVLHAAAPSGSRALVSDVMSALTPTPAGCLLNAVDKAGETALTIAAAAGTHPQAVSDFVSLARTLCGQTPDLDAAESHGRTPLIAAAAANDLEATRTLLSLGANIEKSNGSGLFPLASAAAAGAWATTELLLASGANPCAPAAPTGTTATAAIFGPLWTAAADAGCPTPKAEGGLKGWVVGLGVSAGILAVAVICLIVMTMNFARASHRNDPANKSFLS